MYLMSIYVSNVIVLITSDDDSNNRSTYVCTYTRTYTYTYEQCSLQSISACTFDSA